MIFEGGMMQQGKVFFCKAFKQPILRSISRRVFIVKENYMMLQTVSKLLLTKKYFHQFASAENCSSLFPKLLTQQKQVRFYLYSIQLLL